MGDGVVGLVGWGGGWRVGFVWLENWVLLLGVCDGLSLWLWVPAGCGGWCGRWGGGGGGVVGLGKALFVAGCCWWVGWVCGVGLGWVCIVVGDVVEFRVVMGVVWGGIGSWVVGGLGGGALGWVGCVGVVVGVVCGCGGWGWGWGLGLLLGCVVLLGVGGVSGLNLGGLVRVGGVFGERFVRGGGVEVVVWGCWVLLCGVVWGAGGGQWLGEGVLWGGVGLWGGGWEGCVGAHGCSSLTLHDEFATLPPIIPDGPIAILGLGGGTAAHLMLTLWPSLHLHGWEIDQILIDKAREHLGLSDLEKHTEGGGILHVHIGDALSPSTSIPGGYAGIVVDLFSGGDVLPQLQEVQTWLELHDKLMPNGRLMVNCGGSIDNDGPWEKNSTLYTLCKAFPGQVNWRMMPKSDGGNYLALSGPLPDLTMWAASLPDRLSSSVMQWTSCSPS
ncbi:S-adenosyl-L-methionine-dependent methyltransferases superfamily protein [Tanacetum coccineum]